MSTVVSHEMSAEEKTHGHDAHHGDHHETTWLSTYVFSLDHKMIAKQFLITGMFWGIVGGLLLYCSVCN